MTLHTFLQVRRKAEEPVFKKVLKALPTERFDYRPHERSPSTAEIVWTLAQETKACCDLIDTGEVNWRPQDPPVDPDAILAAFQEHSAALDSRLGQLTQDRWFTTGRILVNDQLFRQAPVGEILWYFFFDSIHHRGQLSTYLRPMGSFVPAIYGPSGDSPSA